MAQRLASPSSVVIGLTSGRLVGVAAQAVSLLLLAKQLDSRSFAHFATLTGYLLFCTALTDLGIGQIASREGVRHTRSTQVLNRVSLALQILLGSAGAAWIALREPPSIGSALWTIGTVALSVSERRAEIAIACALRERSSRHIAASQSCRRIIPLAFLSIGVVFVDNGNALLLIFLATSIAANSIAERFIHSAIPIFRPVAPSRNSLRDTKWPAYALNTVSQQVRQLDLTLLSAAAGLAASADYALAARLFQPLRVPLTSMAQVTLAHQTVPPQGTKRAHRRSSALLLIYPALLLTVAVGAHATGFLGGIVSLPVVILVAALWPAGASSYLTSLIQAASRPLLAGVANAAVWAAWLATCLFTEASAGSVQMATSVLGALVMQAVLLGTIWRRIR